MPSRPTHLSGALSKIDVSTDAMNPSLHRLSVRPDATVRDTLEIIDGAGAEIALVVDDDGSLLGTITDGDVRRALLRGIDLGESIVGVFTRECTTVPPTADRAAVLDLMQARGLSQIPVVDAGGRLVGIHLLRRLLGTEELPNIAVVMAGGIGTRLRPYTLSVPKPMLEVAGRPILERIVLHLVGSGIRRVFLAVNYRADLIEGHFGDGAHLGCSIRYLREDPEHPLGTAGALTLLPADARACAHPLVVMNGDLMTSFSVAAMLQAHAAAANAVTVGVTDYTHQVPYGVVDADGDRITGLREKPTEGWLVNAGVYALDPGLVARVPPGREFPMTEVVARCVAAGNRVGAYWLDGSWDDVGRPEDLSRVRGEGR
ncbi:MAG TPA: sugar phosphate nucleotidyltransferase [Candidatus Dormibacteraeota bacterium]|nr:sugar phosphate nucleotidyltransferase [Candidatus Dormibacteraeota bacterium]